MTAAAALDPRHRVSLAIDGPAGAGKSTVAREVARRLGYVYIDTGAMYRAVAYVAYQRGLRLDADDHAIGELAGELRFEFHRVGDEQHLFVDGEDTEAALRTPAVSNLSSPVSALPGVRQHLVAAQRLMAEGGGVVMEGRDIGTVVLPGAEVKVFVTASEAERARRRQRQLHEQGVERRLEQILQEQRERDTRDSSREVAPLRRAADAHLLVTDDQTLAEVTARLVDLVHAAEEAKRRGEP